MSKVCALTVTYGDRGVFLAQVIDSLVREKVDNIVIVDNNSSNKTKETIERYQSLGICIDIISFSSNQGSAIGFSKGIQFVFENVDCEYIMILDDDNVITAGSLKVLRKNCNSFNDKSMMVAYREGRKPYSDIVSGHSIKAAYANKNAFFGFNLLDKFRRRKINQPNAPLSVPIEIPFGPYGGLFFNKRIIKDIGYPDERFVLYCDDLEYTKRIYSFGGSLVLVPMAIIQDVDNSWSKIKAKRFQNLYTSNKNQLFFSTRNSIYFQYNFLVKNKLLFFLNMVIYLTFFICYSLLQREAYTIRTYMLAVKAGLFRDFSQDKLFNV
ncbi:glycosyltransferase [Saccharicrinis aurantiacus]|uniref:glycosyltransferase n=1 Tax=Saccharicrinis aurantiacus TaxID=1849719 RepID=UPI0024904049|nr:glycosyltransferase [Saccharicrinis aurantiacus]